MTISAKLPGASKEVPPLVTVAIPVLNEEQHLTPCLESLVKGDYPARSLELFVVDGGSNDGSVAIAESWKAKLPALRILNNPKRIQAAAMNIALRESTGEYFVRLDAHSVYRPDHISTCIQALASDKAENVGGVQWPVGATAMQKTIALTLRSPFSMGPSSHRHSKEASYAESVYLGAWRTETLREIGGFDEAMEVAEDYELNIRLRQAGQRVMVDPSLKCSYQVRDSILALARQYFRYGLWKTRVLKRYPKSARPRHSAPGLLVFGLVASLAVSPFMWQVALFVPLLYVVFLVLATVTVAWSEREVRGLGSLLVFPVIHLSYGAGFLWGFITRGTSPMPAHRQKE